MLVIYISTFLGLFFADSQSEQSSTDHIYCLANEGFSDHFMPTYFIFHQDNNYGLQTIREIRCPGNAGIVSCFSTRVEEKELFQRKHQGCICHPTPSKEHVPRLSHPYTQRERIFLTRELTCLKADIILRGFPNLASSSGVLLDGVWSHALFPPKAKPF